MNQIKQNRIFITKLKEFIATRSLITKWKTLAWKNCGKGNPFISSPLLEAIFFSLIEKVSLRAAEVHNLGAAIPLCINETDNSSET